MQFDTGYEFACVQTSPIRRRLHAGKVRVTEATNGVIFQIINSRWFDGNSSFRNLRIILSDLRFHDTFWFVKYDASA